MKSPTVDVPNLESIIVEAPTTHSTLVQSSVTASTTRLQRIALAATIFLSIGAWGFIQPLVPLYLSACGLNRQQIGLVAGLGTGLALLAQPLWGRWSDRIDARRPFMIGVALMAGVAYIGFNFVRSPLAFTLLTALGVNGFLYLQAAAGVLAGRLAESSNGGSSYAGYRFWGSAGYLVVALASGMLLQQQLSSADLSRADLSGVMTFGPLLFGFAALTSLFVPDPKRPDAPVVSLAKTAATRLEIPRPMAAFLIAFGLYSFALNGMLSYLSLYLQELRAPPMLVLGTWAVGVLAEMLMMTQSGKWADRFGRRPLLAIPFFALPLRLVLLVPATGGWWVLGVQCMEALCFGIIGVVAVTFVNDLADDSNRGALQARLFSIIGLTMAISPIAAGWIAELFDLRGLFAVLAVVAMIAAILFWRTVEETLPQRAAKVL